MALNSYNNNTQVRTELLESDKGHSFILDKGKEANYELCSEQGSG